MAVKFISSPISADEDSGPKDIALIFQDGEIQAVDPNTFEWVATILSFDGGTIVFSEAKNCLEEHGYDSSWAQWSSNGAIQFDTDY